MNDIDSANYDVGDSIAAALLVAVGDHFLLGLIRPRFTGNYAAPIEVVDVERRTLLKFQVQCTVRNRNVVVDVTNRQIIQSDLPDAAVEDAADAIRAMKEAVLAHS